MAVDFDAGQNYIGKQHSTIVSQDQPISGVTTQYSALFPMAGERELGIWVKCAGGAPDLDIAIEFSPTTETGDFSELEGGSVQFSGLTDIVPHNDIMIRKPSNWGRVKITGNAGNGADTTVTIVINNTYQGK